MANTKLVEHEDNSVEAVLHQGKPISQWEKDFNGEFTAQQLLKLAKSGVDLQKLLLTSKGITTLDESTQDEIDDKQLFKDEEFFFEKDNGEDGNNESIEDNQVKENRSWYGGGYGGTGKSYSRVSHEGGHTPRGKEIGWYSVSEIDPKARGKMPGWRCGPSNFPFNDALYGIGTGRLDPDGKSRKYKVGTMIMRNKHVNAGSASGIVDIAVPSYFAAIKSNDEDALAMLKLLGIPLDLTFGMDPNDDYSVTYTAIG